MGYLDGFKVTFKKLFEFPRLTKNYVKDEGGKRTKASRLHGRHVLNRYEDGMEKCIGCELCAGVCPARCIYVRGADNPLDNPVAPGERYGFIYEINYLRCIHCDLCVEACPTEAITESKLFEFSFTNRQDAIYTKSELVVGDDGRPKQLPWEDWSDMEAVEENTSAWMRATAPSGAAEFEGIVAWAGELGYGVRAPEKGQTADDEVPAASAHTDEAPADDEHAGTSLMVELFVFGVAGTVCLAGAIGVVASRNPVHAALSLVATLFGIAVLFIAQEAHFLAAVQVIVYAGAIVVLFLFVIMFLGVDRADDLRVEPLGGQRIAAGVMGIGVVALVVASLHSTGFEATGITSGVGPLPDEGTYDIDVLSEALFTRYVFAFELTSVLLVIAVIGAVVLARRVRRSDEIVDAADEERAEQVAQRIRRAEARARVYENNRRPGEAEDDAGDDEREEVKA